MSKIATGTLTNLPTYVFVDASNIRSCCLKTLGFLIDFEKFFVYLRKKYPKLKTVYYFEGIEKNDVEKRKRFQRLESYGYAIRPLERKTFTEIRTTRYCMVCGRCKHHQIKSITTKKPVKKSNVDVFLATEFLRTVYAVSGSKHLILVSCDGDYAEMIRSAIDNNPYVSISVLATPKIKKRNKNTLSTRLQDLRRYSLPRYQLMSIENIKDKIKSSHK